MNDVLVETGLKELKKSLKDVKKEKTRDFEILSNFVLMTFGSKLRKLEQVKNDDEINYKLHAEFSDGVIITINFEKGKE